MSLGDQQYNAYGEQIMKGTLRPERLPQSSGDTVQHERLMLIQLREWVLLDVDVAIGPYRYGWGLINKEAGYNPVYNADPVAPPELLNLTFRKCKGFGCARITSVVTRTKLSVSLLFVIDVHCTLYRLTCGTGNLKMAEGLNSDSESDIDTV